MADDCSFQIAASGKSACLLKVLRLYLFKGVFSSPIAAIAIGEIPMTYELAHKTGRKTEAGKYYPLGATVQDGGVNFALYSKHAREVFLLLFDGPSGPPTDTIRLDNCSRHIWHCFVQGIGPGQLYGYKVRGEYNPERGLRFNEHKLLLDPYARALTGKVANHDNLLLGYDPLAPGRDAVMDSRDSSAVLPKCIVMGGSFDWQGDERLDIPLPELIIYEVHVKGFTAHPSSGVRHPGTYLGFIEKIPYLRDLGINAVEFMPLQEFYVEDFLVERSLTNYWGYNTIGFFSPEYSYSSQSSPGCQVDEFKMLVRELHRAGIEVIMDVVYNHSGEGNELGSTVCFRGIDNPTYYCLEGLAHEPGRRYRDVTGCGNSLNFEEPQVLRMVMDSLRYWVQEMHVDGFRFDLATALGRQEGGFRKSASFFDAISQDPVLNTVKIIAEPWDIQTYQVGNFPVDWSEWNGKFRDTVRRFIRGDAGQLEDLGWRLTGSADLFCKDGRHPYNSINFVTCHDGFTLNDLVSYSRKHNEGNGENNRDGLDENFSINCGIEGPARQEQVLKLRQQLVKNFICCLLFSRGTPMLLGGDEFLRTQQGNNNAYCQDNAVSWFDWRLVRDNADMIEFVKKSIAFRKTYAVLEGRRFFQGFDTAGSEIPDIMWYDPYLRPLNWNDREARMICYQIDGGPEPWPLGGYGLFFAFNADRRSQTVLLPAHAGRMWLRIIDTSLESPHDFCDLAQGRLCAAQTPYMVNPQTVVVMIGR
jgi:isoamylase